MGRPLEGSAASRRRYEPVEPAERTGRARQLRSRVLGLDLSTQSRDGATVLVFNDPQTGEEFDGALDTAERGRRIAQRELRAAESRVRALEEQLQNITAHAPQP